MTARSGEKKTSNAKKTSKSTSKKTSTRSSKKSTGRKSAAKKAGKKKAAKKVAARKQATSRAKSKATSEKKAGRAGGTSKQGRGSPAFRLSSEVRPTATDLHLRLDPQASERFTGEVGTNLVLAAPRTRIELHACELELEWARIRFNGRQLEGRITLHPERESAEIRFGTRIPEGHARLEIGYTGRLREDLCGLYGVVRDGHRYAFSQLAATSARRMFPCFDEPAMKARHRVTVTTATTNTVLANSPVESEELGDDGMRTVHFAPTPPLSTYLIALAVGPLVSSESVLCGETEIRIWSVPGKTHLYGFGLGMARRCLERLEGYFGLPYPYEKLDLIAAPDFEFGAMENPGAVVFRETLLLLDPDRSSMEDRKRAGEVICHELAHMWYGNLVTMAWWDDLWLNESFATWMALAILDELLPEWRIWQTFQQRRSLALHADALESTHAIHLPVATAEEAMENFDLITYEKGASVIRMIERYLGSEAFRDGVRLYIRRHRESNAVAADLWSALAEASGEKIEAIVRPWLEQEGHPFVHVRRAENDAGIGVVHLEQQRLRVHAKGRKKDATIWPIPMIGRVGTGKDRDTRVVRHLLGARSEEIPAQGADLTFLYANADETGFYRPLHTGDELRDLIDERSALHPIERQGLIDHAWALVQAGHAPLSDVLDVAAALGADHDPDVLAAAKEPLLSLSKGLAPDRVPHVERRLRAWVEVYFGAQVDELGWDPAPGEPEDTRLRRARILEIVGVIGEASQVMQEAAERCGRHLGGEAPLDPDLLAGALEMTAMSGSAETYERFLQARARAATPQDEHRLLIALGAFRDEALIERTLELCLGDAIANQDVIFLLLRLLANHHACEQTWAFIKARWPALRRRLPAQLGGRLIAGTPALLTPAYARDVKAFFAKNPLPASERALRQAMERFAWYAAFRERAGPQLEAYLSG